MHDVRVALDLHELDHLDTAGSADAAKVIATQVDEHEVLRALLVVGKQILDQARILLRGGTARTGPRDRVHPAAPLMHRDEGLGR